MEYKGASKSVKVVGKKQEIVLGNINFVMLIR